MKSSLYKIIILMLAVSPVMVYAQYTPIFVYKIVQLFQAALVLMVGLAVVFFLWGLLRYIISESASDREDARKTIVGGLILLFVMVSVWSLVYLLSDTILGTGIGIRPTLKPSSINNLTN